MNMEEKLESHHLKPYLGFNLYGKAQPYIGFDAFEEETQNAWVDCKLKGLRNEFNGQTTLFVEFFDKQGNSWGGLREIIDLERFKPLLHPLDRLTHKMANDCGYGYPHDFVEAIRNKSVSIEIWEDLVKNHNDVFELIPKGLALPIDPK